jgi:engulfment/cell motility protein 1
VRSGLEDLPDRFDLALITEITTANCAPPSDGSGTAGATTLIASRLSFSLVTPEGSLADAIAPDISRWADWTDGLNMLRRDSGHVASKETADFIQALTEIGLKIKLLGACNFRPFLALCPRELTYPLSLLQISLEIKWRYPAG